MRKRAMIAGSGMAVPEEVLDNKFFVKNGPYRIYEGEYPNGKPIWKKDEWEREIWLEVDEEEIFRLTGMKERRSLSRNETVVDLAFYSAENALEKARMLPQNLDAIICACVTMPKDFPSLACCLQERLNAKNVKYAVDISAGCAGSVHALDLANKLICLDGFESVLVVGAEGLTPRTDYTDRNCILFGDGAGALVLIPSSTDEGILATDFLSNSCGGEIGWLFADRQGCVRMPYGKRVMKLGIHNMIEAAENAKIKAAKKLGVSLKEINRRVKLYIPHQANIRMINGVGLGMGVTNVYENIEKYGNMSSASVPIAFHEALKKGDLKAGDLIVFMSFGAGMACGAAVIQLRCSTS